MYCTWSLFTCGVMKASFCKPSYFEFVKSKSEIYAIHNKGASSKSTNEYVSWFILIIYNAKIQ